MFGQLGSKRSRAFAVAESLAAVGILGVLATLGFGVWRSAQASLHVAEARSNLKQVALALDLFFNKYGSYPPQGADLVAVLAPYVRDLKVFENPLAEEATLGATLSGLYREPSLQELDSAGHYVTAFVSSDGATAVVLSSGARIEHYTGLALPADHASTVAMLSRPELLDAGPGAQPEPESQPQPATSGTVGGDVNINPNNNVDFEFDLQKPDGTHVTRDDLRASDGSLAYTGPATIIRLKPKGNGNQNTLTLNGQVYHLENSNRYIFLAIQGGSMAVHLYNSKPGRGKAMGKWWIAINATNAQIVLCNCQGECTCLENGH